MKRKRSWWWLVVVAAVAGGCHPNYSRQDPVLNKPVEELTDEELSRMVAVVKTNYGSFRIELHPEWGPQTVRHFVRLVRMGVYDGQPVHEIRAPIWILIGDPEDDPELTGFKLGLEENVPRPGKHYRGTVGLYHPDFQPELGGSRFYIMLVDYFKMDGGYNLFGRVSEGMAVVDRIAALPTTCEFCLPAPYMPLSPVTVLDVSLEVKTK